MFPYKGVSCNSRLHKEMLFRHFSKGLHFTLSYERKQPACDLRVLQVKENKIVVVSVLTHSNVAVVCQYDNSLQAIFITRSKRKQLYLVNITSLQKYCYSIHHASDPNRGMFSGSAEMTDRRLIDRTKYDFIKKRST